VEAVDDQLLLLVPVVLAVEVQGRQTIRLQHLAPLILAVVVGLVVLHLVMAQ
jgi:hypothetical protein